MPRKKKSGPRTRFQFELGDSERDRAIAAWIDAQPNASEMIRIILYGIATGQGAGNIVTVQPGSADHHRAEQEPDLSDPRLQAFLGIDD